MKIVITGGGGFIGTALTSRLRSRGDEVLPVSRQGRAKGPGFIDYLEMEDIHDADALVNLAGTPIDKLVLRQFNAVLQSRLKVTRHLVEWVATRRHAPAVLVSASALGYYGPLSTGTRADESFPAGKGFLAETSHDWEDLAASAASPSTRVAMSRFALVLGKEGGILPRFALPFRLGAGFIPGSGLYPLSWIHVDDAVSALVHLVDAGKGAYNVMAPSSTDWLTFNTALARTLHRPRFFRIPEFILKPALGRAAEMIFGGQDCIPAKLLNEGFTFEHPLLEETLSSILSS